MRAAVLALLVASCAETQPCVWEHPTQEFHVTVGGQWSAWFVDGPETVLTAKNSTNTPRWLYIRCNPSTSPTYIDHGHVEWLVCLPPHGEERRLTQFMNVDAAAADTCYVAESWATDRCY